MASLLSAPVTPPDSRVSVIEVQCDAELVIDDAATWPLCAPE
ncbi:MAG TPA: hypothetical protein VN579_07350 [Bryobacteraceae bacterium]|nr:hypothetical protein [Bryobacteraceae bacterium]